MKNSEACSEKYCFNWEVPGGRSSPGLHNNLATALSKSVLVSESGCGWSQGTCIRDSKKLGEGTADYYEPHEPNLRKAGLSVYHFS